MLDWSARKIIVIRAALTFAVAALVVGLYAPAANAQAVPGSAVYNWTLPLTGCTVGVTPCDNKPLTGVDALTGVEVYISTSSIADNSTMAPTLSLAAGATTATYTTTVTNGSTLYARFRAVNAHGRSPFSTQATKLVSLPVLPGVPTAITVEIRITP
jgi:hypothetical protein